MGKKRVRRKRSGIQRHLSVFMLSFSLVLLVGMAVMIGSWAVIKSRQAKQQNKEDPIVIDFVWDGKQADVEQEPSQEGIQNTQQTSEQETEPTQQTQDIHNPDGTGQIDAQDEQLYREAVERGETVRLVNCADESSVTFAFAGDILLDDKYAMMYSYKARGSDANDTFAGGLLERMRSADVFMINNEFPFSERGTPTEGKQFTFRAAPANIELYDKMGVDIVSLANNHAYDHGEEALLDTFAVLENADIPYVGAGRNLDEAKKPVYFIANGMKIAVVSATQIERNSTPDTKEATSTNAGVLRCMDPTTLLSVIAEAKQNSDFVILYIHWGTESHEEIDRYQEKQAPLYAQAGVDLIIGDHPHCLQKLDVVSGVPVVYSLGNFWFNSKTQDTCLVEVRIDQGGIASFQFIPCRQENKRTTQLDGADKASVISYMRRLSPNVKIDDEGYVTFG